MFKPLNGRVLVKPDEKNNVTDFGLVLIDKDEVPVTGVVEVGGELVKQGDRILFSKFGYDQTMIDKQEYFVVSETTILGIF